MRIQYFAGLCLLVGCAVQVPPEPSPEPVGSVKLAGSEYVVAEQELTSQTLLVAACVGSYPSNCFGDYTIRKWPSTYTSCGPAIEGEPCSPTNLLPGQGTSKTIVKTSTYCKCY